VHSTVEFYRRRLNESLTFDRIDEPPPAAPPVLSLESEAEVLAVSDDAEFVREAYRFFLGREPDVSGLNYFCDMTRQQGRGVVINELKASGEGQARQARWAQPEVDQKPEKVFRPEPELSGLLRIHDAGGFVSRAYLHVLGRLPDPQGFIAAVERLHAGEDRAAVLYALATSGEAASHGVVFTIGGRPIRPPSTLDRWRAALRRRFRPSGVNHTQVSAAAIASLPAIGAPRTVVPIGSGVVATEVDGLIIGIPSEEWRLVAYHVFRGLLEPGVTRRFCELVKPGMVVVDVGANIGVYTLHAARLVGDAGRVHSFEPTPRIRGILRDNIQINGLLETGRVVIHSEAVTDRRGTARFGVYSGNNGHNTLFADGLNAKFIQVETTTLDEALAAEAHVDVIKIDAEGAEPTIWAGMASTVARNPAIRVFMEFAPELLRRGGHEPSALLDRIEAAGFTIERLAEETGDTIPGSRDSLLEAPSMNLLLSKAVA
jgi:FkbM family methyltransferase